MVHRVLNFNQTKKMSKTKNEKKFFLKDGSPVKFGDNISITKEKTTELGTVKRITIITLTKENVGKLLAKGVIVDEMPTNKPSVFTNLDEVHADLAARMKMSPDDFHKFMDTLWKVYPVSVLNMLLRDIALNFDKQYQGHISGCQSIFVLGITDGKIHNIKTSKDFNYGHFAAFRTLEDATKACELCAPVLVTMYGGK